MIQLPANTNVVVMYEAKERKKKRPTVARPWSGPGRESGMQSSRTS